jgi:hypothetical protein
LLAALIIDIIAQIIKAIFGLVERIFKYEKMIDNILLFEIE